METGKVIRKIRTERELTQKQLAEKSGLSVSVIQKYELGDRKPKLETLINIAMALNVPVSQLMESSNSEPNIDSLTQYLRNVGARIKFFRERVPYTQKELAELAGISVSALDQIEQGKANPTLGMIGNIAAPIGVTVNTLIDDPEDKHGKGRLAFLTFIQDIFDFVLEKDIDGKTVYVCGLPGKEYRLDYDTFLEVYETSKALIKALISSSISSETDS